MKKILFLLIALLAIPIAYAAADVTFQANVDSFNVMAFNCLDASCSQVAPFTGAILKGPDTTDGKVIVRFPSTLATPDGYALFFTATGYRPYEYKATWHTYGNPGIASTTETIEFTKMPNPCKASVGKLNMVSEVEPNKPIVIDTIAALDAQTASAFRLIGNGIDYVPPALKQEFYSADTKVILQILSGSTIIHTQEKLFTAENNNAIFADTRIPVSFKYVPTSAGEYTVKVVAEVIDDVCTTCDQMSAQSYFKALDQPVSNACYTLLNQLQVSKDYIKMGDQILVSFNTISNFVDGVSPMVPVQTDVDITIKNELGDTLFTGTQTYTANPDSVNPVTHVFSYTPTVAGKQIITLKGQCNSALCWPVENIDADASKIIYVQRDQDLVRKVTIKVTDALSGAPLNDSTVTLQGIDSEQTSETGIAVFTDVAPGTYIVSATKTGFVTAKKSITVDEDVYKTLLLSPEPTDPEAPEDEQRPGARGNTPPILMLPASQTFNMDTIGSISLYRYVHDDQDLDSELSWTHTEPGNIDVDILNGVATFTPETGFTGTRLVTFTVTDTGNLSDSDTISVTFQTTNTAPTLQALPDITASEDGQNIHAINLHEYANDAESYDNELVFTITNSTEPKVGVSIVDNKWVNVIPEANFHGASTVTIEVSDGSLTASSTFIVTITSVNDAPVIISGLSIPPLNESTNLTVNLSKVFYDADGDALSYSATAVPNITITFNDTAQTMTIAPAQYLHGSWTATLTAEDPSEASASANFTITILPVNDAPYIWPAIPNIATLEEVQNSIDLTPFENDDEDGPGANGNSLTWSVSGVNTSMFTATMNVSTDFLLITPLEDAVGTDEITLTLTDSTGKNASQNINVTIVNVNDAPEFVNLTNQNANAGELFTYTVNASDVDPGDNLTFSDNAAEFDIDPVTGLVNFTPTTFGAITCNLTVCDDSNATNNCTTAVWTINVGDSINPLFSNATEPADPSVYAPGANYTFTIDVTDNTQVAEVLFEFDGDTSANVTNVSNTYSATLSDLNAGLYIYKWHATDAANNTNSSQEYNFTVSRAASAINLLLNGTDGDFTVLQGDPVEVNASLVTPATNETIGVESDGLQLESGQSPLSFDLFSDAGVFNITAIFAGNQNYNASNETHVLTVLDSEAPQFSNEAVTPASPNSYNPTQVYNFTIQVTDNVGVTSVELELDGVNHTATNEPNTSIYFVEQTGLTMGDHPYLWYASDARGNTNSTSPANYTVTAGIPVLVLTINGVDGDTSIPVNDSATVIANLTNPAGGQVNISIDGAQVAIGASPLTFGPQTFLVDGVFNITAEFVGDANFNSTSVTHVLTVNPPISKSNFNPTAGTAFNYSYFTLTFDTSDVTTCAWDFNDVGQQLMTGTVSSANGINHVAQITGMDLGTINIHVACNNESASANTDLVYTVENILDGSTLLGTNTITNSRVIDSTVTDSTITDSNVTDSTLTDVTANISTITRSDLTNCTVQNSTIIDTTASDCSYVDSYVDPSDTTGSNLVGSTVSNSNVTYSNVTDSTITNSDINNSVITNSVVANSEFEDVELLINANVTDNVLYSGQLTFNGTTYDADVNGPKNLTDLVNYAPVASFTISPSSGTTATTFTLTSTSTDANLGGDLNDTLTYYWTLGDGTNSTSNATTKKYSSTGTKTITLTVTDKFGKLDVATRTVQVQTSGGGGSGGSGGSSGGGGGGGAMRIELTAEGITHQVRRGQPFIYTINGKALKYSMFMRSTTDNSIELMTGGFTFKLGIDDDMDFDLNEDLVPDATVTLLGVSNGIATLHSALYSAVPAAPSLPMFNFTATPEPAEPAEPEVPPALEPEIEPDETNATVDVTAEVGPGFWSKVGSTIKSLFVPKEGELSSESWGVKVAIVIAVIFIGLALFFSIRHYRAYRM